MNKMKKELPQGSNVVVCSRVGKEAQANIPNSRIKECAICDADIWVSPSTFTQLAAVPNHNFICAPCFAERRAEQGDSEEIITVAPNEAAMKELRERGINITAEQLQILSELAARHPEVLEMSFKE